MGLIYATMSQHMVVRIHILITFFEEAVVGRCALTYIILLRYASHISAQDQLSVKKHGKLTLESG